MSNEQDASDPKSPSTHVDVRDAFGRPARIPREQYRDKVLPDLLKAHNDDPDRLAAVLLQAVRDGFAEQVIPAANRLTVIDKNVERALAVLAVVQRDAGELDMAELTLRELREKRPDSPAALVGLGLLAERRGDAGKGEELLWQALEMDCNNADAVHAYLQLRHKAVGDDGYRAELDKVCALSGSWRAQLWLARLHLKQGDKDAAVAIYRSVLAREEAVSEALVMISQDLLQGELPDLIEQVVLDQFQPGKHHPHTGIALLHFHRQKQDPARGEQLLHQMWLHYGQAVGADLQPFTAEFERMRMAKLTPPKDLGAQPKVGLYRLDRPAWYAGYDDPAWVLPQKAAGHKHVVFVGLSLSGATELPKGQEEDISRWMRGAPLFFSEQVWLATPHRGTAALPLAENGTWALMGRPFPEAPFVQQVPEAERADTLLVTGELRLEGDRRRIDLFAFDCGSQQRVGQASAEGAGSEFGTMLMKLMGELWPTFGGPAGQRPQLGEDAFWHRYTDGLAQHAALVVTHAGGMPKDRLFAPRYISQWLQMAMLADTRWQPGLWTFGSALCVLQNLGSKVPLEHGRLLADVFRQLPPDSVFARLAVKPLRACGLGDAWLARRDEILQAAAGDANVTAWLQRVDAAR